MTTSTLAPKFVDLPGIAPSRVDANSIVCVRVEHTEEGGYIVIHTNQGFSFGAFPFKDISILRFYEEVLARIWPEKWDSDE